MANVTGLTPRHLYDATYRLCGQQATVTTTGGTTTTGTIGAVSWNRKDGDGTIRLVRDGGDVTVFLSKIRTVRMLEH